MPRAVGCHCTGGACYTGYNRRVVSCDPCTTMLDNGPEEGKKGKETSYCATLVLDLSRCMSRWNGEGPTGVLGTRGSYTVGHACHGPPVYDRMSLLSGGADRGGS